MANGLSLFDPFTDMTRVDPFRNMDDFFREFSRLPAMRAIQAEPRIRTDLSENDQTYLVTAEIPGVKKEDIKISVDGNRVSITAEVKEEKDEKTGGMIRKERYYGLQSRSFYLPQEVDDAKAEVKYENGILSMTLPKKAGTGAKQLTVK